MVFETRFDVDGRFVVTDAVGQGAYGVVCAALDKETQEMVAIKKICNTFEHNMFCKRTLREIKLLRILVHENIIGVRQILRPINPANFDDIYVISDLMETDLSCIIKSPQALSDEHVQFFLYQLLRAVKFIHTSNVIHRDLKPRNLLVNSNCDLKVCDFGLARVDFSELNWKTVAMTDYIATRWYRAPEVMLKWNKYTKAIDMWSVGCILAELINRKPIFPGTDTEHQVMLINDVLGPFDQDFVSQMKNAKAKEFLKQLQRPSCCDLSTMFREANPAALDLLQKLLEVNPNKRITAEEALCHPYLEALHEPDDEPSGTPISRDVFDFEYQFLHTNELRRKILEEILHHHG
jgi:serine/threonine protein kinase